MDPLEIVTGFDPKHAKPGLRMLMVSTTGEQHAYYELDEARAKDPGLAIVRVEQLYPFPSWKLKPLIESYPKIKNLVWAQEEPRNMGAWNYIYFKFRDLLDSMNKSQMRVSYL